MIDNMINNNSRYEKISTGINFDHLTKRFIVQFCERHPTTGKPRNLIRVKDDDNQDIKTLKIAKEIRDGIKKKLLGDLDSESHPLWKNVVNEFIQVMINDGYGKKTIHNYKTCLEGNTFPCWGNHRIDSITTDEIRKYFWDNTIKWSPSHKKSMLKVVRAVFNYALEREYINRNPVPKIKIKTGDKLKSVLNEDQINYFLTKAKSYNSPWYPIWAAAIYTGCRTGELYALKWSKVDLNNKIIKIDESWNSKDGFKETKSGDDRMVEIAEPLLYILKELKLQRPNNEFVLPRIKMWDKRDQAQDLQFFLSGIGLPKIRFHDLRASWATLMLTKGVEPIKVMVMGGWKELKTMERYIRQAGVDIRGITNCLKNLHDPAFKGGEVLEIKFQKS
ncbi:MAG: site-specific integrase [Oligoflexia bacterium]|nr:site-specific integrase [Oligoflexia bacterium]